MGTLYERIESLCKEAGYKNITEACTAAGVSRGIMTDLKMGRQKSLSASNAQKFADLLGVSLGKIYGTEDDMDETLEEMKREHQLLYDKTKNATPEQLRAIAQMIDLFLGNSPD